MKTKKSGGVVRKRVLLLDDHPLMCEGITKWIEEAEGLEVCGIVSSGSNALREIEKYSPDLVLLDISLPGRNGLELIKDLRARHAEIPVLVYSMHDEALYALRSLRAGARGYLMKSAGGAEVVKGIRKVLEGGLAYSPQFATRLMEEFSGLATGGSRRTGDTNLSDRELEVLHLIGELKATREIAFQLHVSAKTVEAHRCNIRRKLNFTNSADLLRYAIQFVASEAVAGDVSCSAPAAPAVPLAAV